MLHHEILNGLVQEGQSCGAYALTATLASLDLINGNPNNLDTLKEMADNIYVVTGILNPDRLVDPSPDTPEIIEHNSECLNAPSEIVAIALAYINGGTVTLTMDNTIRTLQLLREFVFPREEHRCLEIIGHPIPEAAFQIPENENTISIICVHEGRHWVAVDRKFLYDSAEGKVHEYEFDSRGKTFLCGGIEYDYAGICIQVQRQN